MPHRNHQGFPNGSTGKESFCSVGDTGDWVQSVGWKDPLQEEMATHSNIRTIDKDKGIRAYHYRNHQFTRKGYMRGRKEQGTKQPESNNMALVSPYLSMISLIVNILTYTDING